MGHSGSTQQRNKHLHNRIVLMLKRAGYVVTPGVVSGQFAPIVITKMSR